MVTHTLCSHAPRYLRGVRNACFRAFKGVLPCVGSDSLCSSCSPLVARRKTAAIRAMTQTNRRPAVALPPPATAGALASPRAPGAGRAPAARRVAVVEPARVREVWPAAAVRWGEVDRPEARELGARAVWTPERWWCDPAPIFLPQGSG